MLDTFLVPEIAIEANGEGEPLDLGDAAGKAVLLTLAVTKIAEQQSLDVSVWGSPDGTTWSAKPLKAFPQKFYRGVYYLLLDLSGHPDVRYLRAKWTVNRWGVGDLKPHFSFLVKVSEAAAAAVTG